jgi:hypothetical protein
VQVETIECKARAIEYECCCSGLERQQLVRIHDGLKMSARRMQMAECWKDYGDYWFCAYCVFTLGIHGIEAAGCLLRRLAHIHCISKSTLTSRKPLHNYSVSAHIVLLWNSATDFDNMYNLGDVFLAHFHCSLNTTLDRGEFVCYVIYVTSNAYFSQIPMVW